MIFPRVIRILLKVRRVLLEITRILLLFTITAEYQDNSDIQEDAPEDHKGTPKGRRFS